MNETATTIIGLIFPWFMTSLGAGVVFFFAKPMPESVRSAILGFAAGIMTSASFFALLLPSLEEAQEQNLDYPFWIPAFVGFMVGCLFIFALDFVIPYIVKEEEALIAERTQRAWKLFLSVTLHNIPEGVACGLVFGAAHNAKVDRNQAFRSAIGLAIGIGIQNIPEGAAVSLPVKEIGEDTCKGFFFGVMSGIVEPLFGGLALVLATILVTLDPWALAFSAGAMMYVVVEELIPESQRAGFVKLATWAFNVGFLGMMALEYGLPPI
jgi:ZIP family zinc transporter